MTFPTFADWMTPFLPTKPEPEAKAPEPPALAEMWLAAMAPVQTLMQSFAAPAVPPVAMGNAAMQTATGNFFGFVLGWQQSMQEALVKAGMPAPFPAWFSGTSCNPFATASFMPGLGLQGLGLPGLGLPGVSWPVGNGAAAEASAMIDHGVKSLAATARTQMDSMSSMVGKASKAAEAQLDQAAAMMAETQDKLSEVTKKNVAKATSVIAEASDVIGEAARSQVVKATALMNEASDAAASQMKTAKAAMEQASDAVAGLAKQKQARVAAPAVPLAKDISRKVASTKAGTKDVATKPVASKKLGESLPLPKSLTAALDVAAKKADTSKTPVPRTQGPKIEAAPATPAAILEAALAVQPKGIAKARAGHPDDLKLISGIGPKIEAALNGLGFYHYDQIALWSPAEIEWIDRHLKFSGRVGRENWVGQAETLALSGNAVGKKAAKPAAKKPETKKPAKKSG